MANIKNPIFSLDARGTLGKAVSFTKRRSQNIAEKKPELPYFLTLPVQYQRWLYADYVNYWIQQSVATKQVYASAGVRYHLTGFQYWMKHHLTNLPDIIGYWKLDESVGAIAYDSSRNANHGTIIGASPTTGPINGCLWFDGLNDWINCGNDPTLRPPTAMTLEMFANFQLLDGGWDQLASFEGELYEIFLVANTIRGTFRLAAGNIDLNTGITPTIDRWYHLAIVWDSSLGANQGKFYLNSALLAQASRAGGFNYGANDDFFICRIPGATNYWRGFLDQVVLYNRALTQPDILRHSLRRWPL